MRKSLVAMVLVVLAVGQAEAQVPRGASPVVKTIGIDSRTGEAIPAVTKLHPVIGSAQRTSHFTNPLTHKARYSNTVYDPYLGTFKKNRFKR